MFKPTLIATAALAAAALAPASASADGLGGFLGAGRRPACRGRRRAVPRPGRQGRAPRHDRDGVRHEGRRRRKERQELWLSATRSRMVVTNAVTGKLRVEIVDRPGETRIYDAQKRRVTIIAHAVEDAGLHLGRLRGRAVPRLRPAGHHEGHRRAHRRRPQAAGARVRRRQVEEQRPRLARDRARSTPRPTRSGRSSRSSTAACSARRSSNRVIETLDAGKAVTAKLAMRQPRAARR